MLFYTDHNKKFMLFHDLRQKKHANTHLKKAVDLKIIWRIIMNPALKENKDFLHVLIIGNGFDLAHGLETKYTDFLDSCNNYNSSWFYYFKSKILLDEITKP